MQRVAKNGLAWYTFESFAGLSVIHGAFTRLGGVSRYPFASLNVGGHVGDDPAAVAANHRALCDALGADPTRIADARQVHGDRIARVSGGGTHDATDALMTDVPGVLLLLRFADCVPVWLVDPEHPAIALTHAGWQGTAQRIAAKTVHAMVETFGSRPEALRAGLGPAIGPCCFEVGADVAAQLRASAPEAVLANADHVDLWAVNAAQLRGEGVAHIEVAHLCASCRTDEFYSHRREAGRTGRYAAVAGLNDAR